MNMLFKKLILTVALAFVATFGATAIPRTIDNTPNVHVADRTRYVSNPDNVLSPDVEARLNAMLADIWAKTSAEVVVVAVDEIDGGDADSFATELFGKWGVGKKDNSNGLLYLVSRGDRKTVIRTGYGMEGVVPDIIAGRIIRNIANESYKQGDFDEGTIAAVNELSRLITTPGATDELMSKYKNDQGVGAFSAPDFKEVLDIWLKLGFILAVGYTVWLIITIRKTRRQSLYQRYQALSTLTAPGAVATVLGLGLPLPIFLIQLLLLRRTRTKRRKCPNCGATMKRLDEKADNAYLTPAQDAEEQLNSVDYDVWLCPQCGETDILPYIVKNSNFKICPNCKARTLVFVGDRIIAKPTTSSQGQGVKQYVCKNCGKAVNVPYSIPKLDVPPVIILPPGGGGGNGFGGGFGGGSFGGGMTGGGGASGGW
ncbi:MAG: TPM domain-containing protein [Muribaculum sp.]|nr:TPM domain-containing protein [Muribaculaceae bacterium]MCM1080423.1 TPM domain-containing protein [Muribaculum sp.]